MNTSLHIVPQPTKSFIVRKLTGKILEIQANEYFFFEGHLHFSNETMENINRLILSGRKPSSVFSILRRRVESIELKGVVLPKKKRA